MSDPYSFLEEKVRSFADGSQLYEESANILITRNFKMSLDEALKINVTSPYMECLKYLICFDLYYEEAPKGILYRKMCYHYFDLLSIMPEDCKLILVPYLSKVYFAALSKELEGQSLSDLKKWLDVYSYLKSRINNIESFETSLYLKMCTKYFQEIEIDKEGISVYIKLINLAIKAKNCEFDLKNLVILLIDSIYSRLMVSYKFNKQGENHDFSGVRKLIAKMKLLKLDTSLSGNKIELLEDFFVYNDIINPKLKEQKNPEYFKVKNPEKEFTWSSNNLHRKVYINQIQLYDDYIFQNNNHPMFYVYMQKCNFDSKELTLKVYIRKAQNYNFYKLQKEIDILETLSSYSNENKYFLNFYGSNQTENEVYMVIENYESTLMSALKHLKSNNETLKEQFLSSHAKKMIVSHAKMEELGIYHKSINPCNILVSDDWDLKITNFGDFEAKSYNELELSGEDKHYIRGFKAPELFLGNFNDKGAEVSFSQSKADVFSLGLVLLTMYDFKDIGDLNLRENHPMLMRRVGDVKYSWLKNLIWHMLQLENSKRPSFNELKELIDKI